ncbi:metallophosphoesterase [Konateibacter massiliensis]|uniref:metallophosphoesterase n=1 Tax=Konateibacter massiliensis TaxID=2002841 RepID=UPI000C158437|nr:metallophosphoesterase [Konateibacter massiliensis]
MSIFFIADTHFSEDNIRRYENRPFNNVDEMDKELIFRWNNLVKSSDIIYVLGDFGADKGECVILEKLNGIKYLVKGNHDIYSNEYYRSAGFQEVYDCPIILNDFWILSHKPLYVNENMPYANIFGHVHNSPMFKTYSKQHYCVSVERINYTPVSFEDIIYNVSNSKN